MSTFVYAETRECAERWCHENDVAPRGRGTVLILGHLSGRGRVITGEDRVVWIGRVWRRSDHEEIVVALTPALAKDARIEWVPR